jgi:hypothetical protein
MLPPPPSGSPILLDPFLFVEVNKMGMFYFEKSLKKVKKRLDKQFYFIKIYLTKSKKIL